MPPTNPLEIQEITDQVASYLDRKNLTSCVRVSKSWCSIFLLIDGELGFSDMGGSEGALFGPDRDRVYNHRHLIQELSLSKKFTRLDNGQFLNLRRLVIHCEESVKYASVDLNKIAPSRLSRISCYESRAEFLGDVVRALSCQGFESVEYRSIRILETCMKLESLHLRHLSIKDDDRQGT
jgi:hypothetical protein